MRVVIGRLGRPHGIHGEITADVHTDDPDERFAVGTMVYCGQQSLTLAGARPHKSGLILRFAEVDNRTDAEALTGKPLEAEVDPAASPSEDDAFYDHQLRGLRVMCDGRDIGVVSDVVHGTHQDTLVIEASGSEVLVPFVSALVPCVDLTGARIHVSDIGGLFDPDEAEEA